MTKQIDARQRYLGLATRHFAARGFHGASLATMAADAGVTKQALLHFFGTKERLYAEVLAALSDRLTDRVDETGIDSPEDQLITYFLAEAQAALAKPEDAQLVVRALLESNSSAKVWPLKPYLDRLITLARQTRRWENATDEMVLAGLYRFIGAIQYFAISRETLTGMYGENINAGLETVFIENISSAVTEFVATD